MDLGLSGTAAIVGGASAGMGLAISEALAGEGCAVTMCARGEERLEASAGRIPGAIPIAGDVRDPALLERLVDETVSARGRLDIVVNNAGGPPPGTFESTPDEAWADAFELSLRSVVRLTRLALPHLRQSGRGRVVNITSWSVREPIPRLILSNAIRPGVLGWAKTLAHEVGRDGITVNTIAPGKVATGRMRELWEAQPDPAAAEAKDIASIPVGRTGTPEEIAAAVVFLCSARAGYISGVVLPVDGGALHGVW
jgi:3-oxoacyl-[acyl-carrier protein] reductase